MSQYRHFVIEFSEEGHFDNETVPPSVAMSLEISADPFEPRKWYTEELTLESGATERQGVEAAKRWIDQYWDS